MRGYGVGTGEVLRGVWGEDMKNGDNAQIERNKNGCLKSPSYVLKNVKLRL